MNLIKKFLKKKNSIWRFLLLTIGFLITSTPLFSQSIPARLEHNHSAENCSRKTKKIRITPGERLMDETPFSVAKNNCNYSTSEQWAGLSTSAFINAMKQNSEYDCYRPMFVYDAYSPQLFTNEKIQAVANEIKRMAPTYNGKEDSGIYGLTIYLHIAIFIEFGNDAITINEASYTAIREACAELAVNPQLFAINKYALNVMREYAIVAADLRVRYHPAIVNALEKTIRDVVVDRTWKTITDQSLLKLYLAVRNQIYDAIFFTVDRPYADALNAHPEIIELLEKIAIDDELRAKEGNFKFLWVNATGGLSRLAQSDLLIDKVQGALATIVNAFPRLSPSWITAMSALNEYGDCKAFNLCENPLAIKQELEAYLFPKTVTYDDGAMLIRTAISDEKIQGLYHSAKQVQSQFFSLLQTDEPVEGDTNETINMIVFKSKQDYDDYAPFLYKIPTNNGGMYIETRATFYTWDRTVGIESSLSLESLFRHEYCHYLQGRYLVPGYWGGNNPIYKNSRLVWYEEGMADFFAGATDTEGVKMLAQNANKIINKGADWPTLNTVFDSSYSSGNSYHYTYGNAAWYNWYLHDFGVLKRFFDYTRNNDITGFDNLVSTLRNNGETSYKNFLGKVNNREIVAWQPATEWLDDNSIAIGNPVDIKNEIGTVENLSNISVSLDAKQSYRRFRIEGKLTGTKNTGNNSIAAAQELAATLNKTLITLREKELVNNFKYTVGYYKNMNTAGIPTADVVITGPLKDGDIEDRPAANFTVANKETVTGGTINFASTSLGYITKLRWEFPSGSPTTVIDQQEPEITYNTVGTFNVSLTAEGKNETSDTATKQEYIKVYEAADNSYCSALNEGNSDDIYITRVQLGRLDYRSGNEMYSDNTSKVAVLKKGKETALKINVLNPQWTYNAMGVWIDWNQDGDFEDIEEEVFYKYGATDVLYGKNITPPASAIIGTTRMRVRLGYGAESYIVPCGTLNSSGEIEDYSIVVTDQQDDINTPPSIILLTPKEGQSFVQKENIKVETAIEDDGKIEKVELKVDKTLISVDDTAPYQWANIDKLNFLSPGDHEFTVIAYDDQGASSSKSMIISIEKAPIVYCEASNQKPNDVHITNVSFGNIANSSTFSELGYSDYTHITTIVKSKENVSLTINAKNEQWSYNDLGVWIDWNQDGDFIDKEEELFAKYGEGPYKTNIIIPDFAVKGVPLRMRVRMSYGRVDASVPCGVNTGLGEVEDYIVYVDEVAIEVKPIADFTADNTSIAPDEYVDFKDVSTNEVVSREWNFEGGTPATSTEKNPRIQYKTPGEYRVSLKVSNTSGDDTKTEVGYIVVTTVGDTVPTCTDDIQNGDETGVDCGGSCNPCSIPLPSSYCTVGNEGTNYIAKVDFGSISNTSTNSAYSDYTGQSTEVRIGASVVLTVTPKYITPNWSSNVVGGWIDWNQDGDFTDVGEEVLMKSRGEGKGVATVVVPSDAKLGTTRLRVRYRWWIDPLPCGVDSGDEVEDYSVIVNQNIGNNDTTGIVYVDIVDKTVSASNTWEFFRIEEGDDRGYGVWYAANSTRLVSYGKGIVCNNDTSNITFLGENFAIDAASNFVENPNSYVVSSSSYTSWHGSTGYIGFTFKIDGNTHYGWFHITVSSDGLSYTLLDYAYQKEPNKTIYTGNNRDAGDIIEKERIITTAPNPFKNSFELDVSTIKKGMIWIEIVDMFGKKVIEKQYLENPETIYIGEELSASGVYLLKIKTLNDLIIKRVIKK